MAIECEELKKSFVGKTVQGLECINIKWGRTTTTSSHYLCFVFTDGTKAMIQGGFMYDPKLEYEYRRLAKELGEI